MTNLLTQVNIVNDSTGKKKISFSYDTVDETGKTTKSNQKKSFIVMDSELENTILSLENDVKTIMNE